MLALVVRAADDYTGESAEAAGAYGDTAHAATTGAIALVAVWLPMGPLAPYFKLQALPLAYFGWLAAILAGYFGLTTLMKRWYVRRFGWQ